MKPIRGLKYVIFNEHERITRDWNGAYYFGGYSFYNQILKSNSIRYILVLGNSYLSRPFDRCGEDEAIARVQRRLQYSTQEWGGFPEHLVRWVV